MYNTNSTCKEETNSKQEQDLQQVNNQIVIGVQQGE